MWSRLNCWIFLIYRELVLLVFFYFITTHKHTHTHIYHVLSSRNTNKRHKRTQDIYPRKTPNGGKTQQPFLDRFHSQINSNEINPRTSASSTRNTTLAATTTLYNGSAPPQCVVHKREIPKDRTRINCEAAATASPPSNLRLASV